MAGPCSRVAGAVALAALILLPASADGAPDRSAAIPQLVKEPSVSARSSAALDQISSVPGTARGAVDQIDPAAREAPLASDAGQEASGLAAPAASRRARTAPCDLTADQAAIIQALRMQGQVIADDCDLIEWVAITGEKADPAEDRRALGAEAAAALPEMYSAEAAWEAEQRAAEEQAVLDAARELIVLPGQTADWSGGP